MAKKADDKSTPNEAAIPRAGDLPLEDRNWAPLITEHKRLAERLASNHLAAEDLTKAAEDGVIRCMRRWDDEHELAPPDFPPNRERKLVPSDHWTRHEFAYTKASGFMVRLRDHASPRRGWAVVGWRYFGWRPDIDRFWLRYEMPTVESDAANPVRKVEPVLPEPPRKRGPRPRLTPDEIATAKKLAQAEIDQHQREHPGQHLPQKIWLAKVHAKLLRDGKPIQVGPETLRRAIVGKPGGKNLSRK